jgi:hypothetical protein
LTKNIFSVEDAIVNLAISKNLALSLGEYYEYLSLDERMLYLAKKGKIKEALDMLMVEDAKRFLEKRKEILETLIYCYQQELFQGNGKKNIKLNLLLSLTI